MSRDHKESTPNSPSRSSARAAITFSLTFGWREIQEAWLIMLMCDQARYLLIGDPSKSADIIPLAEPLCYALGALPFCDDEISIVT